MEAELHIMFSWVEYLVVAIMLLLSVLVGVYYTFFNKQKTFKDYMLGGKTMGVLPASMSYVASYISGIALLGIPVEVYLHGTQVFIGHLASIVALAIGGIFYLPVYLNLQLDSIFQYLELRFNTRVRILGTLLYTCILVVYMPVVLFVPAIAFNQGKCTFNYRSIHVCTWVTSICCLLYTTFGGLRAVMWTDTIQNVFTLFGTIFIVVVGCWKLGGPREVLRINEQGTRLELFNFDPDPTARNTVWTVIIGYTCNYMTALVANPGSFQKFLSVPTYRHAKWVLFYSGIGFIVINTFCYFLGVVLYARYHHCDPVAAGVIAKANQMVPLYVMEVGRDYPGLAGLFMSGVMSAALSTLSAWLNAVGGILYTDFMEVFYPRVKHSEEKQFTIIKSIIVIVCIISSSLVVVIEKLGTIYQVTVSMLSIVYGATLSLFTLGIFFPCVNSKGAIASAVASLLVSSWVIINAQLYALEGKLRFQGKVTSIDNCPANISDNFNSSTSSLFNYTGVGSPVVADSSVPLLYQLSYNYYSLLGTLTGVVAGLIVSLLTGTPNTATMNPDLFSPYVRRFLPRANQQLHLNKNEYMLTHLNDSENPNIDVVDPLKPNVATH
ncbi:sodium-coupled monocarboxylate transporter 1-like [Homalodisca vitripennis]|uniref:sodium-coupled monocarboxylate transporter 1-like n=1 Tax=Homalodisca vitripennis TaxID=197043 RepID=UPI001EE9BC8A|nr:sodium-coupled monocarboxylate transporter 1-like [Homalodisca vitripennis]